MNQIALIWASKDLTFYSEFLGILWTTSTGLRDKILASWTFFKLFFTCFNYFVYDIDVDLSEFPAKICMNDCVQLAKHFTQFWIKVILDTVIWSSFYQNYLPGMRIAMTDHLFPISLWNWMSINYSSIVHYTLAVSMLMWFSYLNWTSLTASDTALRSYAVRNITPPSSLQSCSSSACLLLHIAF